MEDIIRNRGTGIIFSKWCGTGTGFIQLVISVLWPEVSLVHVDAVDPKDVGHLPDDGLVGRLDAVVPANNQRVGVGW